MILDKVDKCYIKTDCPNNSSNYYITVAKMKTKTKHINNNNKKKNSNTPHKEFQSYKLNLRKKNTPCFFSFISFQFGLKTTVLPPQKEAL